MWTIWEIDELPDSRLQVAASNASVYTEALLVGGFRPQISVKPGAAAPDFV